MAYMRGQVFAQLCQMANQVRLLRLDEAIAEGQVPPHQEWLSCLSQLI